MKKKKDNKQDSTAPFLQQAHGLGKLLLLDSTGPAADRLTDMFGKIVDTDIGVLKVRKQCGK